MVIDGDSHDNESDGIRGRRPQASNNRWNTEALPWRSNYRAHGCPRHCQRRPRLVTHLRLRKPVITLHEWQNHGPPRS